MQSGRLSVTLYRLHLQGQRVARQATHKKQAEDSSSTLMIYTLYYSKMSVDFYQTTWSHSPEDRQSYGNLKSNKISNIFLICRIWCCYEEYYLLEYNIMFGLFGPEDGGNAFLWNVRLTFNGLQGIISHSAHHGFQPGGKACIRPSRAKWSRCGSLSGLMPIFSA